MARRAEVSIFHDLSIGPDRGHEPEQTQLTPAAPTRPEIPRPQHTHDVPSSDRCQPRGWNLVMYRAVDRAPHVGVHLGSGNVGVTWHHLNRTQIFSAALDQMGSDHAGGGVTFA